MKCFIAIAEEISESIKLNSVVPSKLIPHTRISTVRGSTVQSSLKGLGPYE